MELYIAEDKRMKHQQRAEQDYYKSKEMFLFCEKKEERGGGKIKIKLCYLFASAGYDCTITIIIQQPEYYFHTEAENMHRNDTNTDTSSQLRNVKLKSAAIIVSYKMDF